MNRVYKILALLIEIIGTYIILFSNIKITCISKLLLNISCPACGLTRAFKRMMKLDIISAIKYNPISPLVLLLLITINIYLIYDIITNKKKTNEFLNKLGKYYILIILILVAVGIRNIIKGI